MTALVDRSAAARVGDALPAGLPAMTRRPRQRPWTAPAVVAAVASLPMVMMLISLLIGGGPREEGADDALLTLAMRDATHHLVQVGPYSRFGWHHPGPTYLYLAGIPTRLWGGGPTGSWIAAVILAAGAAVVTVLVVRRAAGSRVGWWAALGVLLVVCGLGPGVFRDPWNPDVVVLPVLFTAVACALALAGARGALVWAAVVGSLAVQTHLSCAPVVLGLLGMAVAGQVVRWRRGLHPAPAGAGPPGRGDIPAGLPALTAPRSSWWRRRPEEAIGLALLATEWALPLWDEAFGSHNLTSIWDFFVAGHASSGWEPAWRQVTAIFGIVMFQHHAAIHDGVGDRHVLITNAVFVTLVAVAVVSGVIRRRPEAVWLGVSGAVAALLSVYSVTRVVGLPYRYLLIWMAVVPVVPALGVVVGLTGLHPHVPTRVAAWARPTLAVAVVAMSFVAVRAVLNAPPAAALTNQDAARSWQLVAAAVGPGDEPVRLVINDGLRWPTASGLALQLERHGHAARVDPPWTLLFGDGRRATGREPTVVYLASVDSTGWPQRRVATPLGSTGRTWLFIARAGPRCWWGWLPLGGVACPVL